MKCMIVDVFAERWKALERNPLAVVRGCAEQGDEVGRPSCL